VIRVLRVESYRLVRRRLRLIEAAEREEGPRAGRMSERKVRSEPDGRRGGLERFVCAIEVEQDESQDSVSQWIVGVFAQSVSKRVLGILEATEVDEGDRPFDGVGCEIAAQCRPRYSRTAS
jgi:hypothetical protein